MVPADGCVIHLLHVQQIGTSNILRYFMRLLKGYSWKQVKAAIKDSEGQLEALKSDIESTRSNIRAYSHVCYGDSIEDSIIKKASNLGADLIVLGKSSHHSRFPQLNTVFPSRIAQLTGIPVLTAKPGSRDKEIKKIVLPINAEFPTNKVSIIKAIQGRNQIQIQVIIFSNDNIRKPFLKQSLLDIFETLKGQLAIPVKYIRLHGENKAKVLLAYSKSIDADMVIVHPGSETSLGGWANRHISDMLPAESKTVVLAVR
ncbi:nucleotide-binding universal stress UspA family protein [Chitinophaga sp. S165]|nr:nucleotide-binding universal stress UspA family protein [Chitinophaga sp. S165]